VGVRFGVEPKNEGPSVPPYKVDRRDASGQSVGSNAIVDVGLRSVEDRVIKVHEFAAALTQHLGAAGNAPRFVALHLEQRPYVQKFTLAMPEPAGSQPLPTNADGSFRLALGLRKNRVMRMHNLVARQERQLDLQGDDD
jgi:hypothetical protein